MTAGRLGALLLVGLLRLVAAPALPAHAAAPVADATISLPSAGIRSHPLWDSYYELAPFGYQEQEYFVSGTASDGAATAPYVTRIIVTRPSDAAHFNGTVLLDWTNVTAQFENAVDTMEAREMLMREGFAFVHVSAQSAGICCTPLTPKVWDPCATRRSITLAISTPMTCSPRSPRRSGRRTSASVRWEALRSSAC